MSSPHQGEAAPALTVAAYPPLDQALIRHRGLWRLQHPDVPVRVAAREMHDHHRALAELLANGVDVPDVIVRVLPFRFRM